MSRRTSSPSRLSLRTAGRPHLRCWLLLVATLLAPLAGPAIGHAASATTRDGSDDTPREPAPAQSTDAPAKPPAERTRPLPYDLAPVRVTVLAAIDASVAGDTRTRQQILDELQRVLSGRLRPLASVTVRNSIPLVDAGLNGLDDIAATALSADDEPVEGAEQPGKVLGLQLRREGARYTLRLREWDGTVQSAGPIRKRDTLDRRLLPHVVATLVEESFRPVGLVTQVENNEIELQIRGGDLQQPAEKAFSLREGEYLVPVLRYLDRDRNVRRIQSIPWTLLRTSAIDRSYVTCEVVSAFGSPLAGSRRRVELVAIRVQPTHSATQLTIIPRGRPDNPLAGTRVDILPRLPTDDDPVEDRVTLLTDRRGTVMLAADPDQPLRWVRVFSGRHLLAQVPMLPGVEPEVTLEVPDDTIRLRVEGELSQLEGDLIDVVARRAVLMASMRGAIKQNNPEQFEALDEQLKSLPDLDRFERRLRSIRLAALGALKEKGDRAAQRNIGRLCDRVLELIRHHLASDPVRELREEMTELRKATQ